jgi:outer membrane protein TolC
MLLPGLRLWRGAGYTLVIWALLLPVAARSAEAPNIAGTLPEDYFPVLKPILLAARQRSPQAMAAEIEIALNEARVYAANAPRLPQINAIVTAAGNQTAISGANSSQSRSQGLFYNVTLNQALFHWGALKNQSEIAAINILIAERSYDEAYRLLALNLRQLFLALIVKKAALAQARPALGLAESNLALEREKLGRGMVARNQVSLRELSIREARLHVARLESDFAGDRRRFARVAGIGELAEEEIPSEIPKPAYSPGLASNILAALMSDGAKGIFEAQIADLRIREAGLRYDIEKVRLRPKFYASAGTSLENATTATPDAVTLQGYTRQTVSVNAQWYIFDGLATRGAKMEVLTMKRRQARRLEVVTEEALEHAQQLERQLAIDAEALEISEIRHGIAAEELRRASLEFDLGNLPKTSLAGAESTVRMTEAGLAAARAVFLSRWSELVSLAGIEPVLNNPPVSHGREPR